MAQAALILQPAHVVQIVMSLPVVKKFVFIWQVLSMTESDFTDYKEKDGWSDEDGDEEEEESLSFGRRKVFQYKEAWWQTKSVFLHWMWLRVAFLLSDNHTRIAESDKGNSGVQFPQIKAIQVYS